MMVLWPVGIVEVMSADFCLKWHTNCEKQRRRSIVKADRHRFGLLPR